MAKKKAIKKIWTPDRFEVEIGSGIYIIEPQPIEQVMAFDEVSKQLFEDFGNLSTKYWVEEGEDRDGPYESEEEAKANMNGAGPDVSIVPERISVHEVLSVIVSTPYPALKTLIPDLKEQDVRQASLPQLKFVLGLIVQANGVEWFEEFLKKTAGPLLPKIIEQMVTSISEENSM